MCQLTVDLDAIAANWRWLRTQHGRPIAAVVKADAYGLGAERVAPRLAQEGAAHFFVAYPQEGATLRPLLPGALIAILNGFLPSQAALYHEHDLAPVLGNLGEIEAWSREAEHLGRRLPALVHVDTGMNRLGLSPAELSVLACDPSRLRHLDVRFVMTHLASAEIPGDPQNEAQARRLAAACLLPGVPRSLANSSGILLGPGFSSSLGRPGAATYGINPTPALPNPMRHVLRLTAPVLQIREIAAGDAVGYNGAWTARRPTRVATVSVGYADGYHRALSNRAYAAHAQGGFDAPRLPLIGRVSMDLATFDATDHPAVIQGSELELIGPLVPPDEVAGWAGTNGYEILTSLKPRGGRIYARL
jgi:alanine racemase